MLNTYKTALALGSFSAFMHLIWSIFVALGWGGPTLSFINKIHFISDVATVMPFSLGGAVTLIFTAFIIAYTVGMIFARIWNKVHEKRV